MRMVLNLGKFVAKFYVFLFVSFFLLIKPLKADTWDKKIVMRLLEILHIR